MKLEFETYVVAISFITSFFAVFLSNGIIIGVPAIAQDFAMNNVIQNWVPTIFFLVVAVFTVPAGQISGKFGVKKSLLAGILVFLAGSIGACLSFSTESFLVFRIIQGAGVAFLNVSAMAMVVHAVKPQNRGKALGFTVTGVYLATSLSPVICGFLVHNLGWRSMFYFVIPFLVLCIILMILKIPQEWKTYEKDKIDKVGSVLYAIGILAFIYGFTSLITTTGKILTLTGLIILAIFGWYELRQKSPVFNMNLFKNKKFTSSNVAALCSYLAIMVVTTILNYHFQYVRGWDAQMSGMILIITPIIMAIMAPNAGKLSDRIHPQKLAALGIGIAAIGNPTVYRCSCNGAAGYRNGALLKSEHERHHELSSSKRCADSIRITGNNENHRPNNEFRAFDIDICMGNGQPETGSSICGNDCAGITNNLYNMYSRMCPCGIRITCRNQVKRQIQHRPLNQKTYLGTAFQCSDIHFSIFLMSFSSPFGIY